MTRPSRATTTTCIHCNSVCHLKSGTEVFTTETSRNKYGHLFFHVCPLCSDSRVGCHPDSQTPLGYAANQETRQARMKLHKEMLDPLWTGVPRDKLRTARQRVYAFLSYVMELPEAHVGEFTIEQCRSAWLALVGESYKSICKFLDERENET